METPDEIRARLAGALPLSVLKKAVDAAPLTVIVTDIDGNIVYANPRFTELTGYTLEESLGRNPRLLKSGHHEKAFFDALWRTIKTEKKNWRGLMRNRKKDGSLYWEEANINPVLDERGGLAYFVAVKEDVTLRKELAEKNQELLTANRRAVEVARVLQRQMITQDLPDVPGYDLSALYLPSESMSGDLFIVRHAAEKLVILMADCTGHGVEASMHANLLWRLIYRVESMLHEPVADVAAFLQTVNRKLCAEHLEESGYPTLIAAVIDTRDRVMSYAAGGAILPVCWNRGKIKPLPRARGMLLGYEPEISYQAQQVKLEEGDFLLFTTDGILEERQHYDQEGIVEDESFAREVAAGFPDRSYVENLEYLFRAYSGKKHMEPLHDDASMVLVKVLGKLDRKSAGERRTIFL